MPSLLRPGEAALDFSALKRLRVTLGHERDFQELLNEFMTSSATLVQQAEQGLKRGRSKEVELAAHTLKSMAKLVGATALAEASRTLELASHNSSAKDLSPQLVENVSAEVTRAQGAVARLLT